MMKIKLTDHISVGVTLAWFPLIFYFLVFTLLTYPLLLCFSTHFFADRGDGLQNVWNLWWVNKSVTDLQRFPWHTEYLHYPSGISLLGSTLNPFNGFMAILLLKCMTLIQTYNSIVIFSFVTGGLTAFWLSYYITRSYAGSLLAGCIFTFSNYHFAHAEGHLQLVSLEWLPLFALCWYLLLTKPGIPMALASAATLCLVLLCDYYYFFYSVLLGFLMLLWFVLKEKELFFLRRHYLVPLGVFIMILCATAGPLVLSLLQLNARDQLTGVHSSTKCSLDLLAPIIPGGHWRFAQLSQSYWSQLTVNIHESSVHIGLSVIILTVYAWFRGAKASFPSLRLWYLILIFFAIMSLGPVLHIWGREIPFVVLPYAFLEILFPPIKLSGAPVRMMVMVVLSASLLAGMGFTTLLQESMNKRWWLVLLLGLFVFEYLPKSIPVSQMVTPGYVAFLEQLPRNSPVLDTLSRPCLALYYQTIHEQPLAFGYVARVPQSVREQEDALKELVRKEDYYALNAGFGFKYFVTRPDYKCTAAGRSLKLVYGDTQANVYEIMLQGTSQGYR